MCHVLLLMPVLALPLFWLAPLTLALPVYLVVAGVSFLVYYLVIKSMGTTPRTGTESIIGATAEVVSRAQSKYSTAYLLRLQGELWNATSRHNLAPGQQVTVVGLKGIMLTVEPVGRKPGD